MTFLPRIDDLRQTRVLLGALLVVVTLLLYLPVVHHEFINGWDDDDYVTRNSHVSSGLKPSNVAWAFTSFELSNWHPVTWLSHMLDCQLFGLNSSAHHYVNVLLHAANVLLLFWILQQATDAVWRSFLVAALFAVHPLNVETVAWVAQRKSLLSAFFSLLTIAAYGLYIRRGGAKRYLLIVCAFALALMSKPMAVSLPLLLLLFDYWPLERLEELPFSRRWARLAAEKIPLFIMSAASSILTEMAQRSGGSVMQLSLLPLSARIENAVISYVTYIGKILWPAKLATFYPLGFSRPLGDVIAGTTLLLGVSALALYFHRSPYIAMGWFFFLITLVPVIGIVQVGFQGMADRYAYIPSIGLFIALTWGLAGLVEQMPIARNMLFVAALCLVTGFAAATAQYLKCWQNGVTLFAHARVAYGRPHMWLEQLYGNALLSSGRVDEALQHYQESCALEPRIQYCHYEIAHILSGRGQFRDAIREYQLALEFTSHKVMQLLCLNESAKAWLQLGDYDAAQSSIAEALSIDPGNETALRLREEIRNRKGGIN
jgi:tetratricopeptide (TPR) repeat protein